MKYIAIEVAEISRIVLQTGDKDEAISRADEGDRSTDLLVVDTELFEIVYCNNE